MKTKLKDHLMMTDCADLYALFHQCKPASIYEIIHTLQGIKEEHQLSTKLSPLVSQIDGLRPKINALSDPKEQVEMLCKEIDLAQRGHSMSRYIHLVDSHQRFTPDADVVLFGDSITEWGPWQDALPHVSHVNRGIAGDTTFGMLRRIDTTLAVKPKLVCIMAGINDLSQGFMVDDVFTNYLKMLRYWQDNECDILIQSTLYCGEKLHHLNNSVRELNTKLEKYSKEHNLHYMDVNQSLSPNGFLSNEYTCDDLHLNALAYSLWLELLQPKLESLLKKHA